MPTLLSLNTTVPRYIFDSPSGAEALWRGMSTPFSLALLLTTLGILVLTFTLRQHLNLAWRTGRSASNALMRDMGFSRKDRKRLSRLAHAHGMMNPGPLLLTRGAWQLVQQSDEQGDSCEWIRLKLRLFPKESCEKPSSGE